MNSDKYIGMDLHSATISNAVVNEAGKLNIEATIATEASAVLDFIGGLQGTLHVAFEEGLHAAWLYDLLRPHVAQVVACDPRQLPRRKGDNRNDKIDAQQLAQWLRLGVLKPVYHRPTGLRTLKELVRSYLTLVSDTTRIMNRLKALYRGRAIPAKGKRVYAPLCERPGCNNCASQACITAPNCSTDNWTPCCPCAARPGGPCSPRAANTRCRRSCSAFLPWARCAWRC